MPKQNSGQQSSAGHYAEWIRTILGKARTRGRPILPLFESTVAEPRSLLSGLVSSAFSDPVSSRYTSAFSGGNPYVIESLARTYKCSSDQLLCTTGATGAMSLLYRALLNLGDHVLVETPGFDLLGLLAAEQGADVGTFLRPGDDFAVDVERIKAALTPRTKLVVLTNLHNPSGMHATHTDLLALAELAERRGFLVLIDEVYGDFATPEERPMPACTVSPHFVSISSLTKSFGLSTLRCGWVVGAPDIVARVRHVAARTDFGVSNLAHAVAALVLENPEPFRAYSNGILSAAAPLVHRFMATWRDEGLVDGAMPRSGCIAFPRLTPVSDTLDFAARLFDRTGIAVVPGEFFGAAGHVRIGFGLPVPVLEQALDGLGAALFESRDAEARQQRAR